MLEPHVIKGDIFFKGEDLLAYIDTMEGATHTMPRTIGAGASKILRVMRKEVATILDAPETPFVLGGSKIPIPCTLPADVKVGIVVDELREQDYYSHVRPAEHPPGSVYLWHHESGAEAYDKRGWRSIRRSETAQVIPCRGAVTLVLNTKLQAGVIGEITRKLIERARQCKLKQP